MKTVNHTKSTILAEKTVIADTFASRMVGLLNRSSLESNEALIITRCQSIHMFFMRFPIDVIFVDKRNVVVGVVRNIKPWRLSRCFWNASYAIEVPAGVIDASRTDKGDGIKIGEGMSL